MAKENREIRDREVVREVAEDKKVEEPSMMDKVSAVEADRRTDSGRKAAPEAPALLHQPVTCSFCDKESVYSGPYGSLCDDHLEPYTETPDDEA